MTTEAKKQQKPKRKLQVDTSNLQASATTAKKQRVKLAPIQEVKHILAIKCAISGGKQYHILWSDGSKSWEPEENIVNCDEAIMEYKNRRPEDWIWKHYVGTPVDDKLVAGWYDCLYIDEPHLSEQYEAFLANPNLPYVFQGQTVKYKYSINMSFMKQTNVTHVRHTVRDICRDLKVM